MTNNSQIEIAEFKYCNCMVWSLQSLLNCSSLRMTKCARVPRSLCGAGCSYQEEEEKCIEKQEVSITRLPQELCDVQPVKTCRSIEYNRENIRLFNNNLNLPRNVAQVYHQADPQTEARGEM